MPASLVILSKQVSQGLASPVQARHYCAHCNAKGLRNFLVRHLLNLAEQQNLAERNGQIGERLLHSFAVFLYE
jgi:hypothetical protein